jgi:hypothetical protein
VALNGIIFGGVVVIWAVFLVPWALRRYDEAMSERPIETFSDAMRVLGRRGADAPAEEAPLASRRTLRSQQPSAPAAPVRRANRAAARAAAARRRRVLLTLLAALVVVGALAAFSVIPVWSPAISAGLVVTWLVLCRFQVRSEDAAAWSRRRSATPAREAGDAADEEVTVRISTAGVVASAAGPHALDLDATPVSEEDLVEATAVAVPVTATDGSSLWDPLPVTLPTYVGKPRAARSIRTIDLGAPGTWTSGHVEGEQTEMPVEEAAPEHRRAVGD